MFNVSKFLIILLIFMSETEKPFLQRYSKPSLISFGLKYFISRGEITTVSQNYIKSSHYYLLIKLISFKTLRSLS